MNIRNFILLAWLSAFLLGCVVQSRPYYSDGYNNNDYYDYRDTPSHEGYYYARIIFIGGMPYYVYDDRQVRPIPPQYRDHFSRYPYQSLNRPPVFSPDREVRDGYPMSRIIYFNGVPYNVRDNRSAEPLPNNLHQRFRYTTPSSQDNFSGNDNRPHPANQDRDNRHNEPPALAPARGNNEPPDHAQNRDHNDRPQFEDGRQGGAILNAPVKPNGQTTPPPGIIDSRRMPQPREERASPQQAQRNAGEPPSAAAKADKIRGSKVDKNKKISGKKNPSKKKSGKRKSGENTDGGNVDDTQPSDGRGRKGQHDDGAPLLR